MNAVLLGRPFRTRNVQAVRFRIVQDQYLDHRGGGAALALGGELQQRLDLGRGADGKDFVLGARHGDPTRKQSVMQMYCPKGG